ncbi:MAG: hypothetical protein R3C16_08390 [Hyphomonadaceae bacterium]
MLARLPICARRKWRSPPMLRKPTSICAPRMQATLRSRNPSKWLTNWRASSTSAPMRALPLKPTPLMRATALRSAHPLSPGLVIKRAAPSVIAVLRGVTPGTETPGTQAVLNAADARIPHLELAAAPAAPADLLRLRPDVARAEAQTLVAAASVADARTNLLPR